MKRDRPVVVRPARNAAPSPSPRPFTNTYALIDTATLLSEPVTGLLLARLLTDDMRQPEGTTWSQTAPAPAALCRRSG